MSLTPETTVDQYERFVAETAVFPDSAGITYTSLALCGEAGELAEKVKKAIRGSQSTDDSTILMEIGKKEGGHADLVKEAGDVLWYLTALLAEIGSSLQEAMDENVEKLTSRRSRGVLHGSGDNR